MSKRYKFFVGLAGKVPISGTDKTEEDFKKRFNNTWGAVFVKEVDSKTYRKIKFQR